MNSRFESSGAPTRRRGVLVAVDHDNIHNAVIRQFGTGAHLAYERLLDFAATKGAVRETFIYISRRHGDDRPYAFGAMLKRLGFDRVVVNHRRLMPDGKQKSNSDVALALHVGMALARRQVSHLVLASGDGDFSLLCEQATAMGVPVDVVAARGAGTAMNLVVAATHFTAIDRIPGFALRPLSASPAHRTRGDAAVSLDGAAVAA